MRAGAGTQIGGEDGPDRVPPAAGRAGSQALKRRWPDRLSRPGQTPTQLIVALGKAHRPQQLTIDYTIDP